jgi:hypothetical protein
MTALCFAARRTTDLALDAHRPVDDSDAALERHGPRHLHSVTLSMLERSGAERPTREPRSERDLVAARDPPFLGAEQEIAVGSSDEARVEVHGSVPAYMIAIHSKTINLIEWRPAMRDPLSSIPASPEQRVEPADRWSRTSPSADQILESAARHFAHLRGTGFSPAMRGKSVVCSREPEEREVPRRRQAFELEGLGRSLLLRERSRQSGRLRLSRLSTG